LQGAGIISPATANAVQAWQAGVNQRVAAPRNAFDVMAANSPIAQTGRIGGQILGTAPLLGAAGIGAKSLVAGAGPLERTILAGA
jgi:hypothetical protein